MFTSRKLLFLALSLLPAAAATGQNPPAPGGGPGGGMPPELRRLLIERGIDPDRTPGPATAEKAQTPDDATTDRPATVGEPASSRIGDADPVSWPRVPPAGGWSVDSTQEVEDGLIFNYLVLNGSEFSILLSPIHGLVRREGDEMASVTLAHRLDPDNRLVFFDFDESTFPGRIDLTHLSGYANWLDETHGASWTLLNGENLMPPGSFLVQGRRWGYLHYSLETDEGVTEFVEFFIPYRGRALVFRLQGDPTWVAANRPEMERSLASVKFSSNLH